VVLLFLAFFGIIELEIQTMKFNFLDVLYRPIRRKQQIISYGTIALVVLVLMLFLIPSEFFFKVVFFSIAVYVLFMFLSGLQINEKNWTIISVIAISIFIFHSLSFGQSLLFYVAALAIVAIATLRFPAAGMYTVILCSMWFERHFTLQSITLFNNASYKIYPLDFVIILIIISVIYRIIRDKWEWKWNKKFDLPILIFGIVCSLNFLWVVLSGNNDPTVAFSSYKNYFLYVIFYILLVFIFRKREQWINLFKWFSAGGIGLFFFLIYGVVSGAGLWSEYTPLSTIGSRLIAGTHIFFMILFGFWVLALYLWPNEKFKYFTKKTSSILLALISLGILVSLVRHLWLALIVMIVFWLVFMLAKRQSVQLLRLLFKGFLFCIVAIFVYTVLYAAINMKMPSQINKTMYVLQERTSVSLITGGDDSSASWRLSVWKSGLQFWSFSPVFGLGLGKSITGTIGDYLFDIAAKELHNNYLAILVQLGIVGALVVIYWFYTLLRNMHALWQKTKNGDGVEQSMLFFAINTVLLFMIVYAISVYWDLNFFVLWWWLAIAVLRFLYIDKGLEK